MGEDEKVRAEGVKDYSPLDILEKIERLEEILKKIEEENERLRRENNRLRIELRALRDEIQRLEDENSHLRIELETVRRPPLLIGEVEEIVEGNKAIIRSSTGPRFLVTVHPYVDRKKLVPGARVALNQATLTIVEVLKNTVDPLISLAEVINRPEVTYNDIGGLEEQIREIREAVELPMLKPELFERLGIDPPKGVLLIGPPGTGKTLLAKAVAHHTEATFIHIVGSELVQKYVGEGARLVRELFQLAREKAPSIIFIDEIDAIGAKRSSDDTSATREVERTLMQLLAEMDGFDPRGDVKIIGATNRPDILDPALLRPGRFDRIIYIPMPNLEAREEIFRIHTRKMKLIGVDFRKLAEITEGFSGADIKAACTEAGMFAIREERDYVKMEDFLRAIRKVREMQSKALLSSAGSQSSGPRKLYR